MTTFGLTDNGFTLKRLADILDDMVTALGNVVDPVSGESLTVDLSDENDPLIQEINAFADGLSVCWEQLQLVNNQFDPNSSTGTGLSALVQLNGLRKKSGTYSTVILYCTGTANLTIAAGQQVSPISDGNYWTTNTTFTFDSSGHATVLATCNDIGAITASAGTLIKIVTPQDGWQTVTNISDAVAGTNEETETELRARRNVSTSGTAVAIIESVYSSLRSLENVTAVRVYQNITLTTDANGVPSKSIAAVVQGGTDADIANVLWLKTLGRQVS